MPRPRRRQKGRPLSFAAQPSPTDHSPTSELRRRSGDDTTLESIADTVGYAAGAIEGLRDVLDRLNSSVARAQEERSTEVRLGQLFTRAQDFVDGALADAREQAKKILQDAEAEAFMIVSASKAEAERVLEEARHQATRDTRALEQLDSTIATFNRVNAELVAELSSLQQALVVGDSEKAADDVAEAAPIAERADSHPILPPDSVPVSPTFDLSGSWMHDEKPLWGTPAEYTEPKRRFWRRPATSH